MAQHSHPSDRRERITERQKAINLLKELKKRDNNCTYIEVEHPIKNYIKIVRNGKDL